jgi:acyl transferase domain-containing protein
LGSSDSEDHLGRHPVRWQDAVTVLYELGARLFVEPRPGRVLTSLAEESFPDARCIAVEEVKMETAELLAEREHADRKFKPPEGDHENGPMPKCAPH